MRPPVVDDADRQLDLLLLLVQRHVVEDVDVGPIAVDGHPLEVLALEPEGSPVVAQRHARPNAGASVERVGPGRERGSGVALAGDLDAERIDDQVALRAPVVVRPVHGEGRRDAGPESHLDVRPGLAPRFVGACHEHRH